MNHAQKAQQGHKYQYGELTVIAMEPGITARVREIDPVTQWLGREHTVKASWLKPLPMVYYGGEVPV